MTFKEKLEKYNYIKFIKDGKEVCSEYITGKCYKFWISDDNNKIWVKDERNDKYLFWRESEKKRLIFVTDKYAEKYLST